MATSEDTTIAPASRLRDGEPAPSRRSLLSFFTAAAVVTPVAAMAATAPVLAASTVQEVPEILAIGEQFPALCEAFRLAVDRKIEAAALYERTRPALPEDLIDTPAGRIASGRDFQLSRDETDIDGRPVFLDNNHPRKIYCAKNLQIHIIRHDVSQRTKEGKRLRKLVRLAKKYESDTDAAVLASGYEDATCEVVSTARDIERAAKHLLKLTPLTLRGVMIYADMTMIVGGVFEIPHRVNLVAALGDGLANAQIRIQRGEARS